MKTEEKFEEIYTELKNNYQEELRKEKLNAEKEKKENFHIVFKILIVVGIIEFFIFVYCIIINIDFFQSTGVGGIQFFIIIIAGYILSKKVKFTNYFTYEGNFKSKIMTYLIKSFDENLEFLPLLGISEEEYKNVSYEKYDIYKSSDLVQNSSENKKLSIASVLTQNRRTNSRGEISYHTVFDGMFVKIKLEKNTDLEMYIRRDIEEKNFLEKPVVKKFSFEKMNIKLDSSEFEKLFDVYSSNEIITMQILTADAMELLIDLQKKLNNYFEITIKNNNIYIRLNSGNIFDMNLEEKYALDKDALFEKYKNMEYFFNTTHKIKEMIEGVLYL